jgi:hypothetical protein
MHRPTLVTAIGAAVLLWAGVSAQQEVLPKPGPGSGITRITGAVEVSNAPSVHAVQQGGWEVAINNTPTVRIVETVGPSFLKQGRKYEITWDDGKAEVVTVAGSGRDGWIEVSGPPRRWINLTSLRTIQDAQ